MEEGSLEASRSRRCYSTSDVQVDLRQKVRYDSEGSNQPQIVWHVALAVLALVDYKEMMYICPTHKRDIPRTYGEVFRFGDSESERGVMLRANGRPDMSAGVLTREICDWNIEVALGERCWYCGVLKP